jgi:putative tricarboxylic transport membrane protein
LRPYQVATAVAFMFAAAVAMIDSRAGALVDTTGTQPGGIGAGFYPFWSAFVIFVCAAVVAYKSWQSEVVGPPVFEGREGIFAVLKLVVPMIVAVVAILWLGFYVVSGLYMGFFARWIGKYNWLVVLALTVGMPAAIYAAFELGFRVSLPKSFLYGLGVSPF